jgi:fluoride exporter
MDDQWASPKFPRATFTINVTGSFAIGFLTIVLARSLPSPNVRVGLLTGLIGGYTTFSTFSFETLSLWERGGRWGAVAYVVGSVLTGLLAVILGVAMARFLAPTVNEVAVVTASGPGEEERA